VQITHSKEKNAWVAETYRAVKINKGKSWKDQQGVIETFFLAFFLILN